MVDLFMVIDYFGIRLFQFAFEYSIRKLILLQFLQFLNFPLEFFIGDLNGVGKEPLPQLLDIFET